MQGIIRIFSDRFLIIAFILSLIVSVTGLFIDAQETPGAFALINRLTLLSGLFLVLKHSRLVYEHRHVRAIYICMSLVLLGSLFKLESWGYSLYLFAAGFSGIIIAYIFRILSKKTKGALDFIKLSWVILYFTGVFFLLEHLPLARLILNISFAVFLLMMLVFCYEKREQLLKAFN